MARLLRKQRQPFFFAQRHDRRQWAQPVSAVLSPRSWRRRRYSTGDVPVRRRSSVVARFSVRDGRRAARQHVTSVDDRARCAQGASTRQRCGERRGDRQFRLLGRRHHGERASTAASGSVSILAATRCLSRRRALIGADDGGDAARDQIDQFGELCRLRRSARGVELGCASRDGVSSARNSLACRVTLARCRPQTRLCIARSPPSSASVSALRLRRAYSARKARPRALADSAAQKVS